MFNPVEIIIKKRQGYILNKDEMKFMVENYIRGTLPDYQMSAFLMAIFFKGMDTDEIVTLTEIYIKSGSHLQFDTSMKTVDKHSTGGVGDKISIVLAPIAAALGCKIPMISGRGLGHTGGTLDKLEAIPGFRTNYEESEFRKMVEAVGLSIIAQSEKLVPADKKIYALRDVSGTVESLPLITASIMSKKLAEGAQNLVIDLKMGTGAFMKNMEQAEALARSLIRTGEAFGQKVKAVFTNMNSPIGYKIGNSLEIIECIDYLKGINIPDMDEINKTLTSEMLIMTNIAENKSEAYHKIDQVIHNGKALDKLREMIVSQSGDPRVIEDYSLLPQCQYKLEVKSSKKGFIKSINSQKIGYALILIDAGRKELTSPLNYGSGCELYKKVGDFVESNEVIGYVYCDDECKGAEVIKRILESYIIAENEQSSEPLILKTI